MPTKSFDLNINTKIPSFNKTIEVDSDKSMSIRSFLIGSISQNISSTKNVLESEDVFSTINCLKKLGVKIVKKEKKSYLVYGKGLGSLFAKKNTYLNFGNSGTLARLLIGILSTTPNIEINLSGDNSLNKRNMKKLIDLMTKFGAFFLPRNKNNFPLKIISSEIPLGFNYKAGVSAQLKSAVILAGLNAYGITKIIESDKSRDHTEKMLAKNPKVFNLKKGKKNIIYVHGKKSLSPINISVPGDPSSAAFFTALTLLNYKSKLIIKNVGLNKTRIGFYNLLKKTGTKILFKNLKKKNNEVRGDIIVKSSNLSPISAPKKYYVNSTDEYPILFVIAALIKGISVFRGIEDLSNKESNRIKEMQKILRQIGVKSIFKKK
tara:strand:+ start:1493 stop:2623 length:1131 start_codon:yes stop_codon:yes gene_type:complete